MALQCDRGRCVYVCRFFLFVCKLYFVGGCDCDWDCVGQSEVHVAAHSSVRTRVLPCCYIDQFEFYKQIQFNWRL